MKRGSCSLTSVGTGVSRVPLRGPSKATPLRHEKSVPSLCRITITPFRQP